MTKKLLFSLFLLSLSPFLGNSQNTTISCGTTFTDNGGPNANYANNSNVTTTFSPILIGQFVTVNFVSFALENNFDRLKIYNGASASAPLLADLTGSTLPPNYTSTDISGCLTFVFTSDSSVNQAGWVANILCGQQSNCVAPTSVMTTAITTNSATVSWNTSSNTTSNEVLLLPCGTAPTVTNSGTVTNSNPYVITDLTPGTCYNVYVRTICTENQVSLWSIASTFTTTATCPNPQFTNTANITANSFSLSWNETGTATSWETIIQPCGTVAPNINSNGTITTETTFNFTNLNQATCYSVYIRSICSETDKSTWSGPYSVTTPALPPVCGGQFIDSGGASANYGNNENSTVVICPTNTGDLVTVTFTSFDAEINWDALFVYDGDSTNAPQISSTNGAGFGVLSNTTGGFWGTTIPGPFTSSSPDGCLTFRFVSDGSITRAGWNANITCSPDQDKIILIAFVDSNNNGIKDSGETNFSNGSFLYDLNDLGTPSTGFSPSGQFAIYDTNPVNSYDISYQLQPNYATYFSAGSTNYSNVTIPVGSSYQILYFPITIVQPFNDVTVSIVSQNPPPRPGFNYTNKIIYKNLGLVAASGTLTFTKDSLVTIANVSQAGTVANANGFTYSFTNLAPNETRYFYVTMTVPTIPTVSLGTVLTNVATISSPANDINLDNNSFSNAQIIVGSWDPNDKAESHGGRIIFSQYNPNEYLNYTIRFQNEGTADAEFVIITDVLDAQIDETSIQMISASHNYSMKRVNNTITWDFRNINLVPKIVNEAASMGYVQFRVKLKPGIEVGDVVPNTANIFFDFNPAIVTNTFNTEFVAALNNQNFDKGNFVLYPNPSSNYLNIRLQNTTQLIDTITIIDVLGKTVKSFETINSNEIEIDTTDLVKGIYFVTISSNDGLKQTQKLIKN